jgi:hypothetical protein
VIAVRLFDVARDRDVAVICDFAASLYGRGRRLVLNYRVSDCFFNFSKSSGRRSLSMGMNVSAGLISL